MSSTPCPADENLSRPTTQQKRAIAINNDVDSSDVATADDAKRPKKETGQGRKRAGDSCFHLDTGVKRPTLLGPALDRRFPTSASSSLP